MRVGQLLTMFSFVRFPLKDATVIHPWFLFSMSSEVQLRECRRQQLERWPYCLHLSMAKHGKLWLAAWQHLATSGNTGYSMSLYYWGGSRRVLRGVLRFPTKPRTWPADIADELWNAWNAWKLSCGAVLELWQTEVTTYFGEKTRKPKSFLCTCLRTIVRSHFHGISWHGNEVSTEALNPLPRSLVTGSHWGITGIDAGCLRLGSSDQCPGRTEDQCRTNVATPLRETKSHWSIYICANLAGLHGLLKIKLTQKGGFNGFDVFRFARTMCEWSLNDHWMISMSVRAVRMGIRTYTNILL